MKIEMDEKTSTMVLGVLSAVSIHLKYEPFITSDEMKSDEGMARGLMRTRHMLIDDLEKIIVMEAVISGEISLDDVNTDLLLKIGGRGWRKGLPMPPQPGSIGKLVYDMKLLRGEPLGEEAP